MKTSLQIVIPVLNEELSLSRSVNKLYESISSSLTNYNWKINIVDNGSTDKTSEISKELVNKFTEVFYTRLELGGRGRALRTAWIDPDFDIHCYMDVDLSTDLSVLPSMLNSIRDESNDLVIGSRLKKQSKVIGRPWNREVISRIYSFIMRIVFIQGFKPLYIKDYQCGFKAISSKLVDELLPLVKDNGWFFDSELIVLAIKNNYKVKEIPVRWVDDPDTRVKIIKTAIEDLTGIARLKFGYIKEVKNLLSERN